MAAKGRKPTVSLRVHMSVSAISQRSTAYAGAQSAGFHTIFIDLVIPMSIPIAVQLSS